MFLSDNGVPGSYLANVVQKKRRPRKNRRKGTKGNACGRFQTITYLSSNKRPGRESGACQ
jgi:hypothetical protein